MWLVLSDFGLYSASGVYYEGPTAWDAVDEYLKASGPSCRLQIRETEDTKFVFLVLPSYYLNREKKLFEFSKDFSLDEIKRDGHLIRRLQMYMSDALGLRLVGYNHEIA